MPTYTVRPAGRWWYVERWYQGRPLIAYTTQSESLARLIASRLEGS